MYLYLVEALVKPHLIIFSCYNQPFFFSLNCAVNVRSAVDRIISSLEILTFSKSSLAEGKSAASERSPVCFSILSPLTTVFLTTLLTFRPCTGSTSNSDAVAAPRARGSEKVSWRGDGKMLRTSS